MLYGYVSAQLLLMALIELNEFLFFSDGAVLRFLPSTINLLYFLCLFFVEKRRPQKKHDRYLAASFGVIFLADYFLCLRYGKCFSDLDQFLGFAGFCAAELLFSLWLKPTKRSACIQAASAVILLTIVCCLGCLTPGIATGTINLALLAGNLFSAWKNNRREKSPASRAFLWAIALLFGCDYCIAGSFILPLCSFQQLLYYSVWIFYVPCLIFFIKTYRAVCKPNR